MSKITANKPFPVTWPQSGATLFLTCRARSRNGRTAVAMKWRPLQSSKPAIHVQSNLEQALSRDLAPIRGYVLPHLSGKVEERQNCFCTEVALAELQTSSSQQCPKYPRTSPFPWVGLNPGLLCSLLVGQAQGKAELLLQ